ncbi:MAG: hypothetical protein BGO11_11245 [Solirubrobacterales bacterium 70-9]|nr:MAG: hypothetical protein BGO11_11245 [Solirubrobacterales bacterium 70-9]
MIVAVFRRKLKPGKTIEDFTRAWEAEKGFGVPARVFTATSLSDPSEILTVGFVDLDPADLEAGAAAVAEQEQERHERIADVIESTELREFYALGSEHDFTAEPREIDPGSPASLLAALRNS